MAAYFFKVLVCVDLAHKGLVIERHFLGSIKLTNV